MKDINIAICGFGTVGKGVYTLLNSNKELLKSRLGFNLNVRKILVKDINKKRDIIVDKNIFTENYEDILNIEDLDIIVEVIGGTDLAKTVISEALRRKISVVTANKALLALNGFDIVKEAERNKSDLFFEASVAGGIPVIKIFKDSLVGNNIEYIYGILNGTCNYILTQMSENNMSFDIVLKKAQEKGYAEQDPTFDIEGMDAAHKLAILISLAYDIKVDFNDIYIEGISKITDEDIKFAFEFGYAVKLLAIAKKDNGKIEGRVHPVLIEKDSILSNIKGVYNAVYVKGDFLGPSLYYGKGAGSFPTASSVVSDIVDAAINIDKKSVFRKPVYSKRFSAMKKIPLKSINNLITKYYLRFSVKDQPGVLSKISGILGKYNISIEAVIQKGRALPAKQSKSVPIVMITHESLEKNIKKALEVIDNLDITMKKTFFIRIENFNGKN